MHLPTTTPHPSVYYHYKVYAERRPATASTRVAVVGAGPVGLLIALDLARFGVGCVVLAEECQVSHGSRAVVLTRRSIEILRQIGVERQILEKGLPWCQGRSYYRGKEVYRMIVPHDRDDRFAPLLNVQQQFIEQYLIEACESEPLIELCWGQKVVGFSTRETLGRIRIDSSTGEYDLDADWVVAADGGRSAMRRLLGQRLEGRSYAGRFIICDIKASIDLPTERLCYFEPPWSPGSNVLVHRLPDDIWRIDLKLPDGETPEEALQPPRVAERINAVLRMVGHPVPWELDWAAVYSANTLTLPDYRAGRVVFVGDAAHLLPIFGVRGLNTGIQDANNLAWKLAFVAQGWAPSNLLETYSFERVRAAREICAEAGRSTRFMTPQTEGSRLLRDAVLSFSLSQDFMNDLLHWRTSRPHDYVSSPLNTITGDDKEFLSGISCGQPIRDVDLADGTYFLDYLRRGPGFHLLAFVGAGPPSIEMQSLLEEAGKGREVPVIRAIICQSSVLETVPGELRIPDPMGAAHRMYGAIAGTVYLVRPDFHVCARWLHPTAASVLEAIHRATGADALGSRPINAIESEPVDSGDMDAKPRLERRLAVPDLEAIYDEIAEAVDACAPDRRALLLAKLALALANLVGDRKEIERALRAASDLEDDYRRDVP
jgi:3-(3-hydroxy-phenyl)propionate hydroxylase